MDLLLLNSGFFDKLNRIVNDIEKRD